MKCVICDKHAEYIHNGDTLCKVHLLQSGWNDAYDMEERRALKD